MNNNVHACHFLNHSDRTTPHIKPGVDKCTCTLYTATMSARYTLHAHHKSLERASALLLLLHAQRQDDLPALFFSAARDLLRRHFRLTLDRLIAQEAALVRASAHSVAALLAAPRGRVARRAVESPALVHLVAVSRSALAGDALVVSKDTGCVSSHGRGNRAPRREASRHAPGQASAAPTPRN